MGKKVVQMSKSSAKVVHSEEKSSALDLGKNKKKYVRKKIYYCELCAYETKNISNNIDDFKKIEFDFIITVCDNAKEKCPVFYGEAIKIHRSFADPALATGTYQEQLNVYIDIRDQLKVFFQDFSNQLL